MMNFLVVKAAARLHERQHIEERLRIQVESPRSHPVDNRIDSLQLLDFRMANHQTQPSRGFQVIALFPNHGGPSVTEREVIGKQFFVNANGISVRTNQL